MLDSIGKVLISKGDKIAVEAPTYLGAIQAFNPYEPQFVTIDTDDDGLIPLSLEEILRGDTVDTAIETIFQVIKEEFQQREVKDGSYRNSNMMTFQYVCMDFTVFCETRGQT